MIEVPRWFWLVLTIVLIGAAIRFLDFPVWILFVGFWWGYNPIIRWARQESAENDDDRHARRRSAQRPPVRWAENSNDPAPSPTMRDVNDTELGKLLVQGRELAVQMRQSLPGVRDPQVRQQMTSLVDEADRILTSVRDHGDTELARTFVDKYLTPSAAIMTRYTRIVGRDLTSARPVLERVERHDLPLLQKRYGEFYQSLHRGDLIDLEVASEMLAFELDEPVNGTLSLADAPQEGKPAPARAPIHWGATGGSGVSGGESGTGEHGTTR